MVPPRQLAALAAVGLGAAVIGFAGAAWLAGEPSPAAGPAPAAAAVAPAAAPEEALLEQPPSGPSPAAPAPPRPEGERERAPAPVPPPEGAPLPPGPPGPPRAEPPAGPASPPATTRGRAPAPPAPEPEPDPAPAPPPPRAVAEPAPPPEGVAIPAGEAPTGHEPARRQLVAALGRAAPGSVEEADIRRLLALWREALGPGGSAPPGRRATIARALRANAWWYARRAAPAARVLLRDADGVILTYRAGQAFAVNAVATTGRWRGLNADVPPEGLAAALLSMGVERRAGARRFLVWEYYDLPGDPAAIVPGPSGMAQARVALVMAYAAERTGDAAFARAALLALAALTVDVDRGGVRSMVSTAAGHPPAPWYVERAYPGAEPWTGGALNGFMVTLLNLRGAAAALDRAPGGGAVAATAAGLARDLADRGAASLARHLPDHDTGSWSLYGLLTPGRPWRSYLADLNYHCYHVRLLGRLAVTYPDLGFADVAARWQGYVERAGVACPAR
ncbi:D-glucuronyl C5-epimerase family protein [Miltoncostaea marina]|uniref:D-glucuronyl C5-epimerase family protein n=1 Tax=Miltoncostaea marina TaxID=2843215 RepID=UPI001C3D1B3A|nr:D-glucuronyl C5-epimerase family protein [Miltoncostaea marina]